MCCSKHTQWEVIIFVTKHQSAQCCSIPGPGTVGPVEREGQPGLEGRPLSHSSSSSLLSTHTRPLLRLQGHGGGGQNKQILYKRSPVCCLLQFLAFKMNEVEAEQFYKLSWLNITKKVRREKKERTEKMEIKPIKEEKGKTKIRARDIWPPTQQDVWSVHNY